MKSEKSKQSRKETIKRIKLLKSKKSLTIEETIELNEYRLSQAEMYNRQTEKIQRAIFIILGMTALVVLVKLGFLIYVLTG